MPERAEARAKRGPYTWNDFIGLDDDTKQCIRRLVDQILDLEDDEPDVSD